MASPERRKAERHSANLPGTLFLSEGREMPVRILNIGGLGALVSMTDLEEAVLESERAVLEHPLLEQGAPEEACGRTPCAVVRVELDFAEAGVARHLALFFDGGAPPEGYEG
ncbi:MAG: hypothetical protein ACYTG6_09390 [Planctomycetota bacterium]|jgi:hypothetical protein